MRRFSIALLIAIALSWTALIRTDGFSPSIIEGPLLAKTDVQSPNELFYQPFHYLGKGRQCFVFESQDGKAVIKFFNQKYLKMPWYSFLVEKKEKAKRSLRRHFYENSYEIAFKELGEEILYLHLGSTHDLPQVTLTDRASRTYHIDLNRVPFVLQKKGEPIYSGLEAIYEKEGLSGLCREIDVFLAAVSKRIAKNIADADTDVANNWGYVEGRLFHLDPGRLFYDEKLQEPERLRQEWNNATRGLHKWLKVHYPEADAYLERYLRNQFPASLETTSNFPDSSKR
jgi:hypothetical protein